MASTSRASNREKCLRLQVEDWTASDEDESAPRETEPLLSESASHYERKVDVRPHFFRSRRRRPCLINVSPRAPL